MRPSSEPFRLAPVQILRGAIMLLTVFLILVLLTTACLPIPGAAGWSEREGPDGARYAVPPGWRAFAGEEAERKSREGMKDLPETVRALAMLPRIAFLAYRGEDMLAVFVDPAKVDLEMARDPQFWETTRSVYQQVLELVGEEMRRSSGGRIRMEIDEIWKGSDPDALGVLEASLRIRDGSRELPVRYRAMFYRDRIITIAATGNAPLEEFLRRSSFPAHESGGSS